MARIDPLAAERAEKGGQGRITLSGPAFGETAAKRITLSGPAFGEPAAATTNRIQLSGPVFGDHSETTASRITLSGPAFGETTSPAAPSDLNSAKLQAAERLRRATDTRSVTQPPVGHDAHIVPDPTSTAHAHGQCGNAASRPRPVQRGNGTSRTRRARCIRAHPFGAGPLAQ